MVETITGQADNDGRYTAGSMHRAWKEWFFVDEKVAMGWVTFLVLRLMRRIGKKYF